MRATKYTLSITLEALSKDCFPGMLSDVQDALARGIVTFKVRHDDGDYIAYDTQKQQVSF